ncbi:MAG: choice-of-anchor U domain-containing protein, partial [Planctomycetota bacterium]
MDDKPAEFDIRSLGDGRHRVDVKNAASSFEIGASAGSLDDIYWSEGDVSAGLTSSNLPLGEIGFVVSDLEVGGSTIVNIELSETVEASGYQKKNPETGEIYSFHFDGETGAVIDGHRISLHLVDGGRGDADGIANGIIIDPGGPTFDPLLIQPGSPDALDGWTVAEYGGTGTARGTVAIDSGGLLLSEGNSLLVELSQDIVIPAVPTLLEVAYEGEFDSEDANAINDAFEMSLLDSDGNSVIPTFGSGRDSFFNLSDGVSEAVGPNVTHQITAGVMAYSGVVQADISSLPAGQTYRFVMRLVNNDNDTNTRFRLKPAGSELFLGSAVGQEGSSMELVAVLSNESDPSGYSATVSWGDGSADSSAAVVVNGGDLNFVAEHTYADDLSTPYPTQITVFKNGTQVALASSDATIQNVSPLVDPIQDIAINTELQPVGQERQIAISASFFDAGILDTHTYSVDWGDGSSSTGDLTTTSGIGVVSATHDYAANGTYDVVVSVADDEGAVGQQAFRAYIAGDAITVTQDSFVELDLSGLEVEAGYNNELGMFIVEDANGGVRDANGVMLWPGDAGYALAAITHSSRRVILHRDFMAETKKMAGPSRPTHDYRVMVEAGSFISFYSIQDQTTDWWIANNPTNTIDPNDYKRVAFFSARAANPDDAHPHFRISTLPDGSVRYSHEDLLRSQYGVPGQNSDEDYDDLNFTIRVRPIATSPEVKFFVDNDAPSNDAIFFYGAEGGSRKSSLAPAAANDDSIGLTSNFNGSLLWSLDQDRSVYKYNYASSGHALSLIESWTATTELDTDLVQPTDIASDSSSIWIVDNNGSQSKIYHYFQAAVGQQNGRIQATDSFVLHAQNTDPSGLAVDATRAFVTDQSRQEVFIYQRSSGSYLGRWTLDPGNQTPTDITTEPTGPGSFSTNLYVVDKTRGE